MRKFSLVFVAIVVFLYAGCDFTINPTSETIVVDPQFYDFGDVLIGDKAQIEFIIHNYFNNSAILSAIEITGDNIDDFIIRSGGSTPAEIASKNEHVVTVEFVPQQEGLRNAHLTIEYNATGGTINCLLKGKAIYKPIIEVNPNSYDFGDVAIDAHVNTEIEIVNPGNETLRISNIEIIDDADGNFSIVEGGTNGLEITINLGETHNFRVEFHSLTSGKRTAKFQITHNADDSKFVGELTANASTEMSLSPSEHDFGEIQIGGKSEPFKFTLSNPFSTPIAVSGINILLNPDDFEATPAGSGGWLVPANGGTLAIEVVFSPTKTNLSIAELQIIHSKGTLIADISGTGFAKPEFSIKPTEYDFGTLEVFHSKSFKFKVSNTGTDVLRLTKVEIQNDSEDNFIILTGTSGTSINSGSSAIIEIRFLPQSNGAKNAVLRIEHNVEDSPAFVALKGLAATIALTPADYDFGNVGVGIVPAVSKEFTVVNATAAAITISNIDIAGTDESSFDVTPKGNGSWQVEPGGKPLRLAVTCSPETLGKLQALLKVTYESGQLTSEIQANGVAMPTFSITPENYNFGYVNLGSFKTYDFVIRNVGDSDLIVSDVSIASDTTGSYEIISGGLTNNNVSIPKNSTRTVRVKFTPKVYGLCEALLQIEHNANGSPFNGSLRGTATGPYLSIIPNITEYDFGDQFIGKSSEMVLYLQNSGNANLTISSISLNNNTHFTIQYETLPIVLEPGKVSVVKIAFAPSDSGVKYCELTVGNSSVNTPFTVSFKGNGKKHLNYLFEDFEGSSAPGDWWVTHNSDWEWGHPRNTGPSSAYSGTCCYGTNIDGNYRSNQNCVLVSPRIDLTNSVNPMLGFYMWANTQANYDGCWVEISTNDGGSWTALIAPNPSYDSYINVSGSPKNSWNGNKSGYGWISVLIDLANYKGNSQIRLLWYFYSNSSTTYPGVYIDDVSVFEDIGPDCPRNPVPVVNDISVPIISNKFTLKWDCDEGETYDVYLDTVNPPTKLIASGIKTKYYNAPLFAGKTYFWRVVAHNLYKSTNGPIWYFKTVNGVPRVLINEVDTSNNNDYIEFYNTESYMVYIGKWQMSAYDNGSLQGTYEFDDYIILYPKEVIVLHDSYGPSTTRFRTTFNILWTSISSAGEVIWQYPQNYGSIGVDYMRFNVVVPNHMPVDLNWSGLLTASSSSDLNWYRNSTTDTDSANDWNSRRVSVDTGIKNPGQ